MITKSAIKIQLSTSHIKIQHLWWGPGGVGVGTDSEEKDERESVSTAAEEERWKTITSRIVAGRCNLHSSQRPSGQATAGTKDKGP